jgi:hypothetical protein
MYVRNFLKSFVFYLIIFTLMTMLVSGCVSPSVVSTRTPTSTPRTCPPIVIDTPDVLGFRKTVIVVLLQPSPYYEYSTRALEVINYVIPKVIEPGDSFYMLRAGIFTSLFEEAILSNEEAMSVSRPSIPATPTYIPTVTSTVAPVNTPQSIVGQQGATAQAEQTVIALNATATQSGFIHNCAMQEWDAQYRQQAASWEATKEAVRDEFAEQIQGDTDTYQQQIYATPTALPKMIYESFAHVTLVFNNYECGEDDRCFLIIFSDLNDSRPVTPENVKDKVNLTGVKIISVMFNCDPIFQPDCKSTQDKWTENFSSYYAGSPPNYINGNDIENTLVEALIRR